MGVKVGVMVGVVVGVFVGVMVAVGGRVKVGVTVGLVVGVDVWVEVGVTVGVKVGVSVAVGVGVLVGLLVGVGVLPLTKLLARIKTFESRAQSPTSQMANLMWFTTPGVTRALTDRTVVSPYMEVFKFAEGATIVQVVFDDPLLLSMK